MLPQQTYPLARRALQADIEGAKRKRVVAAIAAFQDEGHGPSLRDIAKRAKLKNWKHALHIIKRLEADGLLEVQWAPPNGVPGKPHLRNEYEVLL